MNHEGNEGSNNDCLDDNNSENRRPINSAQVGRKKHTLTTIKTTTMIMAKRLTAALCTSKHVILHTEGKTENDDDGAV